MGINLNLDYSTLFSSLSSGRTSSNNSNSLYGINLADYASIKNGSYFQVTKAYYAKNSAKTTNSTDDSNKSSKAAKANADSVQSSADSLKDSADKLMTTGKNSLFQKKDLTVKNEDGTTTTKNDYDTDAIYKAVKDFADKYNATLKAGGDSTNNNVLRQTLNLKNNTAIYKGLLSDVGITIDSNNQLSVNEDIFKKSNMTTVKSLFNGTSSMAFSTSLKASQISYYADKAISTYDNNGTLNNPYASGTSYNSFF